MTTPDLNLLVDLDVLLSEGSVVRAARRLGLSPSAMSRTLARLREVTGDPLLVRAGRALVPTPRALDLRTRIRPLVDAAEEVLRPALRLDLTSLSQTFTLRCTEGFVETFGPALLARVTVQAPGVRLAFVAKQDKDSTALRDGLVDLETGVTSKSMGPELRSQGLFRDRFIAVVRHGHPLGEGCITPQRYAAAAHVIVSRRGLEMGAVDQALAAHGLTRQTAVTVGGFGSAIALAGVSDMVATVPERHTQGLWRGLQRLVPPLALPAFTIALFWHPRVDADPAHRWIRGLVVEVCRSAVPLDPVCEVAPEA